MDALIKEYSKRLKLSWVRQHFHEVEATTNEEYLLKILENEIQQREVRKINLLFKQSSLPRITGKPFEW
ncbi:ATP-binding protein, partial [Brevibacillus borstelensis]|nr:ATP-binding protein [Brevibacillus borstelensis]MCM3562026.1 ATP-binding protein [Brevibacillus borstelensis]